MLNYYLVKQVTYHNGEKICVRGGSCLTEDIKNDTLQEITWENLESELVKCIFCSCGFSIWYRKKGRHVEFYPDTGIHKPVKEWKSPNLNIQIKTIYTPATPSIDTLLHWHDGDKAIQYLVERGITIFQK